MGTGLPAGWYADPADSSRYRFWTGERWTTDVRDKGEAHIAAAEAETEAGGRPLPDFDADLAEATEAAEGGRGRRRLPVALALVLLVALVATAGVVTRGTPPGDEPTLSGVIRVDFADVRGRSDRGDGFLADGARCGDRGGRGLGAGSEVQLTNARGEALGHAELAAGRLERTLSSTTCVFPFQIDGVGDAGVYVVTVAGREAMRASRQEVARREWELDILLP